MTNKDKFEKLNINMSKQAMSQIEEIRKRIDATSKTEVIKSSLKFYNFITDEKQKDKGLRIILQDSNGNKKELLL